MDRPQAFGQAVKEARHGCRLTQEELAEIAKLHSNYISLIERGLTNPALDTIFALASALGTLPSKLMARAEELSRNSD